MVVCTNDVRWPSLIGEGRDEEREREIVVAAQFAVVAVVDTEVNK